jgi:hypothetical protein
MGQILREPWLKDMLAQNFGETITEDLRQVSFHRHAYCIFADVRGSYPVIKFREHRHIAISTTARRLHACLR